jgi:hypothetical protein
VGKLVADGLAGKHDEKQGRGNSREEKGQGKVQAWDRARAWQAALQQLLLMGHGWAGGCLYRCLAGSVIAAASKSHGKLGLMGTAMAMMG